MENNTVHFEKYRNFIWFPGVEILRKGTVSPKFRPIRPKLCGNCFSAKFPHQEIRWNYGIFRSVYGIQVSVLGPLLFNIFLYDLICFLEDTDLAKILSIWYHTLQCGDLLSSLFKRFSNNNKKVISGQSYLLMSRTQRVIAKIDDIELEFQNKEEVLETDMLTFEYNIIFLKKS